MHLKLPSLFACPTSRGRNQTPTHPESHALPLCGIFLIQCLITSVTSAAITGTLDRDYWLNLPGNNVSSLIDVLETPPSGQDQLGGGFEALSWDSTTAGDNRDWADDYGQRIYGYLVAPATGSYTFWIAADNTSQLKLSSDEDPANASIIAHTDSHTAFREYDRYPATQQSSTITLQGDHVYFVEVLHKEGAGGDHLSVAWDRPDDDTATPSIIPASVLSSYSAGVPNPSGEAIVPGSLTRHYWEGLDGNSLSKLTSANAFPANPDGSSLLTENLEMQSWSDEYGQRLFGYLVPPSSGHYTFWVSGDNEVELYLSPTGTNPAEKQLLAYTYAYTSFREWDRYAADQKSDSVYLNADLPYYIEVLHKEGLGGDHVSIGWAKPGESDTQPSEVIPATNLAQINAQQEPAPEDPQWVQQLYGQVGAQIDENPAGLVVLHIDSASTAIEPDGSEAAPFRNIRQGFHGAGSSVGALHYLGQGTPVHLKLAPGHYRQDIGTLTFEGAAVDTLLIVEGEDPSTTIWTGADFYPAGEWESLGNGIYAHTWTPHFTPYTPQWGAPDYLGHRHEIVMIDGQQLKQQLLEVYTHEFVDGDVQDTISGSTRESLYTYVGLQEPATLEPGSFGVIERDDSGDMAGKIYIRPADESAFLAGGAEVTVRQRLANWGPKNNWVLRNLTVTQAGNGLPPGGVMGPIRLEPNGVYENVLIDNCRFVHNNANGLRPTGASRYWTIRDSEFSHNGYSGINGTLHYANVENCRTNFNNWRGNWGGVNSWFVGGVKLHNSRYNLIQQHQSIGNLAPGFWYDIHCEHICMVDLTSMLNTFNLFWELSWGPFYAKRALLALPQGIGSPFHASIVSEYTVRDSILYANTDNNSKNSTTLHVPVLYDQFYQRSDSHAVDNEKGHPKAGNIKLEGSVIIGGNLQQELLRFDTPGGKAGLYENFDYTGIDNVYWVSSNVERPYSMMEQSWERIFYSFTEWESTKDETHSVTADPLFISPEQGDFRLQNDSPLQPRAAQLPVQQLDPALLQQAADYFDWAGFSSDFTVLD